MSAPSLPRYQQIAAAILDTIQAHALPAGHRLPSVRALAEQHQVHVLTALQAYRFLEQHQHVCSRPRAGFFVALPTYSAAVTTSHATESPRPTAASLVQVSGRVSQLLRLSASDVQIQLHMAEAAGHLYPTQALGRRLQQRLQADPALLGAYFPEREQRRLRQAIQEWAQHGQLDLHEDEILMTHGSTEAIQLALRVLTQPGDTVAVETPVYFGLLQTLEILGLKALEIPCSLDEGLSPEALEFALRHGPPVRCLIVVPHFQNPTGALMPEANKKRILALAQQHQLTIIEDDVFGDLHFTGERPIPLKAWDRAGEVIYCASFTKSFAPAFRLGWISGGRYHAQLEQLKVSSSYVTSPLMQAVLSDSLSSGLYARHLLKMRNVLARRCEEMRAWILACFPKGTRVSAPKGGLLVWVMCPEPLDTFALLEQALDASMSFAPGRLFSAEARFSHCLRLNIAHPQTLEWRAAIQHLGQLAQNYLRTV